MKDEKSRSKFLDFQSKLDSLDDSIDNIDQEENKKLSLSDKKNKDFNRKLRKKDSLSDSDDLAPNFDLDIKETEYKETQEFKIDLHNIKNEEYDEDAFEDSDDSLEDKPVNQSNK